MKLIHYLICILSVLLCVGELNAQEQKIPGALMTEQVRDNLYMISGEGGNVAAYVTEAGVILVDNMFDRNYQGILEQVSTLSDKAIIYVLNTHQHDDHAGGDLKFLETTDVIAHENVFLNLSDIQQPYYEDTPGTPIGLPNITFTDGISIFAGGKEVQALYMGRGHSNGDAIIYFPDLGIIHSGDLFLAGALPELQPDRAKPAGVNIYIDYAQGGSFLDWSHTLDRVLELDFDLIIPGHGRVSSRDDLLKFRADLETMRETMADMIRQGASKEAVVKVFESDYGWRSTGCPPSPPTAGCLQFQQMDALIDELQ